MSGSAASVFEGPAGIIPVVNTAGNIYEEVQVATAGQTVFTLLTFQYTPGTKTIIVLKNGVELRRAVGYAETSNTTVTLAAGAALNDVITLRAYAIGTLTAPLQNNGVIPAGANGQVLAKSSGSDYALQWLSISSIATLLDQPRQNVASAPTVDLTPFAATSRNILITGTTQIDGFAITNGQTFILKFAASLTLSNNASLVTPTGAAIKIAPNDSCIIRATADNVVEVVNFSKQSAISPPYYNDHRLSLATGNPVAGDLTAQSTIYLTAYRGNNISLFNGSAWVVRQFTEINIALAALTVFRPYDVFCYDNAGTPTLEILAWASQTARATGLIRQDGVYVKNGDATRKYIGTFYTTAANQTNDSSRQRHLWNMYNRVRRDMQVTEATANWAYTVAAWRQANANGNNQVEFTVGISEDSYAATLNARVSNNAAGPASLVGIGENTYVSPSGTVSTISSPGVNYSVNHSAVLRNKPAIGINFLAWLEDTDGTGVATWVGGVSSQLTAQWLA